MNEIKNQNDILVATLSNPQATTLDLVKSNIMPNNTGFLSMDEYRDTKLVKRTFTDDKGIFNEDAFKTTYLAAGKKYQELTDKDVYTNLEKELEYSPTSMYKPRGAKTYSTSPALLKVKNPFDQQSGITSLFGQTPISKSIRELAQNNKIWDSANNKWMDKTPDDLGIFGSIFSEPLVYAQWEEDGEHLDKFTGRNIFHKKGEYKTDDYGKYYTETLNGREVYGKQVVAATDTLTKEGTWLNKIDYFDSDGLEKSAWGTTFKIATQVVPYLIPGVNEVWGGITAAYGLASVLPTFYKAIDGIFSGNEETYEQNSLWKAATNTENWFSKFNNSFSDEAQSGLLNYEQLGTLVGDIFSQIYQQRAMASISKYLKANDLSSVEKEMVDKLRKKYTMDMMEGTAKGLVKDPIKFYQEMVALSPELKVISERQSKLAKSLSLGYMALTSTADVYGDAIQGGYDRRTAGAAALTAAASQYGVMMNNSLGDWFLDKTTGYNEKINRSAIKKALRPYYDDIEKSISQINTSDSKVGKVPLQSAISKAKNSVSSIFDTLKYGTESFWGNAGIEAVEEVTEEAVMDAVKGVVDFLSWSGVTKKQGSFDTINNTFSEKGFERYLTSALGGFVGGAMFKANEKLEAKLNGVISPEEKTSLIHEIANGRTKELLKEAEKFRKIGNSHLSTDVITIKGDNVSLSSKEGKSQADVIADSLIDYIKYVDGIVNQEDLKNDDDTVFKKALLNHVIIPMIEDSGIHKLILSDQNQLIKDIVDLRSKIDKSKEGDDISKLESQLFEKRKEIQSLLNGEKHEEYLLNTLFYLNKYIHEPTSSLDIDSFAKHHYGVDYYTLPEKGEGISKEIVDKEYKKFVDSTDVKDYLNTRVKSFKHIQELFSPTIKEYSESKYKDIRKRMFENVINSLGIENASISMQSEEGKKLLRDLSDESIKGGGENLTLEYLFNIKPSDYLINESLLDLNSFDSDSQEKIKVLIDEAMKDVPLNSWNSSMLQKVLDTVHDSLQKVTNKYNENNNLPFEEVPQILLSSPNVDINFNKDFLLSILEKEKELDSELVNSLKPFRKQDLNNLINSFKLLSREYIDEEGTLGQIMSQVDLMDSEEDLVPEEFIKIINESSNIKEALEKIKELFKNKAKEYYNDESLAETLNRILNKFNEIIDSLYTNNIKRYDNILSKNVRNNPLYDFLRELEITIDGDVTKSIFNILQEESNLLKGMSSLDNYIKLGYGYEAIVRGINTLQMAKSVVYGMETSDIDFKNPFGFNQSIRNYLEKYKGGEGVDKYQELSPNEAYLLNQEFDNLISRLQFLKNLSDSNAISKADEHKKTREKFNSLILDKLQNTELSLGTKSLTEGISEIIAKDISDEYKLQEIEVIMFNNFNEELKNSNQENILLSLFKNFNFDNMLEMESYGLNPEVDKISDYDLMVYIMTSISLKSDIFNLNLKNIILNENFDKCPFFVQEYAAKISLAIKSNPKLFESMSKIIFDKATNEDFKQIYGDGSRIYFLNGISGAGKTSVSGQYTLNIDLIDNPESRVLITAPGERQIKTIDSSLKSSMTKEEIESRNLETFNRKELFDFFLEPTESGESVFDIIQNNLKLNSNERSFIKILKTNDGKYGFAKLDPTNIKFNRSLKNIPTSIYIDEITHFSKIELELLNLIAKEFGFSIFTYGDTYQVGAKMTMYNSDIETNIDQVFTFRSPKLKMSVRSGNIHKKDNTVILENTLDQLKSTKGIRGLQESIDVEYNKLESLSIELKYFEDKNRLHGDKITSKLSDKDLSLLKDSLIESRKTKPDAKIGILTKSGEISEDIKLKLEMNGINEGMYKLYSSGSYDKNAVQGAEEEFFLILDLAEGNSPEDSLKSLYTYLTRSLSGSILVDEKGIIDKLFIKNVREKTTNQYELDKNIIRKVKDERLEVLNELTAKTKKEEHLYTKDTKSDDHKSIIEKTDDIDISDGVDEVINESMEIVNDGKSSFPEEYSKVEGTPFHYMGHLFYNHLGIIVDNEKNKYKMPDTKNKFGLNLLNIKEGDLIEESLVIGFIRFKNLLSLYNINSDQFWTTLKSDDKIIKFLKKCNINVDSRLRDDLFVDKLMESNIFEDVVVVAKRYDEYLDSPAKKQNLDKDKVLKNNDIFLTIAQKIKDKNGNIHYITISALPKLSTLLEKFDKDSDTYTKYDNLISNIEKSIPENDVNSVIEYNISELPKSNKNTKNNPDKLPIFDFLTGIRLEENKEGYFELEELYNLGMVVEEEGGIISNKTRDDGEKEFFKLLNQYRDTPLTQEQKNKLLDSQGRVKARGRAYVVVSFTQSNDKQFKKLIILTPKIKTFEKTFNLYLENSPKNDTPEKKFQRNSLLSSQDQLKMLFALNEGWTATGAESLTTSFSDYLKSLSDHIIKKSKVDTKDTVVKFLGDFHEFIKSGKNYQDYVNSESKLKIDYKGINTLGGYILGHLESLKNKLYYDLSVSDLYNKIYDILSDENGLMRNKYYSNPKPVKIEEKGAPVAKVKVHQLGDHFHLNVAIEMPRVLVNLESILNNIENPKKIENTISETSTEERKVDERQQLKLDTIEDFKSQINNLQISNEAKELLLSIEDDLLKLNIKFINKPFFTNSFEADVSEVQDKIEDILFKVVELEMNLGNQNEVYSIISKITKNLFC